MEIKTFNDVIKLRESVDLDCVSINLEMLDEGYVPSYVVKFGIWALKHGGILEINCKHTVISHTKVNKKKSFYYLLQIIMKAVGHYGALRVIDYNERRVEFTRTMDSVDGDSWSFGVVYSGAETEWENLCHCVKSIRLQNGYTENWEIVVCGPAAKRDYVVRELRVKYLCLDLESKFDRFEICKKKNLLIDALIHNKILICHTRIILDHKCIKLMPRDFEVITPRVLIEGVKRKLPYLDLGFVQKDSFNLNYARMKPCFYERKKWIRYARNAIPYIDGGLFCINKQFVKNNRLCESLAWGEAEDVDWSRRLIHDGFVAELCTRATALSQTCKLKRYQKFGHTKMYRMMSHLKRLIV